MAELDLSTPIANPDGFTPAEVLRALRFTPSGVEEVRPEGGCGQGPVQPDA